MKTTRNNYFYKTFERGNMLDREAEVIKNLEVILILFLRAMHHFFFKLF